MAVILVRFGTAGEDLTHDPRLKGLALASPAVWNHTHPGDERKRQAVEVLLGSPKWAEPATQTIKSDYDQMAETADGGRSIG
jgi:hypothetical protein